MSYPFPVEIQQLLQQGLATGQYASEDEMLLEGLRLLRERDAHFQEFRERLQSRLDRLDRGEGIELENDAALRNFFDDVQVRGRQRYEACRERQ
jgi:Arc/MetJ-type ribon-helix-helix transcriptional regulator